MLNRLCERFRARMQSDPRGDHRRRQVISAHRRIHGTSTALRRLVQGKSSVLFHYIDDGRLHELVETGKLLIDESLFVEETVDHDPQVVLGEWD